MDLSSWFWVALFIAFSLGWFFSRYDIKNILQQNNKLPLQYFKGLQYILNEQPDKAIDEFIQVAQLNPETVDLHLALGQMFRKKGEFTRSIRIHESLANRGLGYEYQEKAYIALAEDYYRAGMFDRAEKIFTQFISNEIYKTIALKYLLIMAKLEQNWVRAIELTEYLPFEQKEKQKFHLQLVYIENLIQQKNYEQAKLELNNIDGKYHQHTRLIICQANLYILHNDFNHAIQKIKQIISLNINNDITYEIVLPIIKKIYADNTEQLLNFFKDIELSGINIKNISLIYNFKYTILFKVLQAKIQKHESIEEISNEIKNLLEQELTNCTSIDSIKRYTNFLIAILNLENVQHKTFLLSIKKVLANDSGIKYICNECGFRSKGFSWACHGCGEWETLARIND